MIQVASGLIRGLKLKSPSHQGTRPTSERTRQAIFNYLRHYYWRSDQSEKDTASICENAVVADLFAGTGAFGIEALSNGASRVIFVENAHSAIPVLKENTACASQSLSNQAITGFDLRILPLSIDKAYPQLPKVRILFCDPPYGKGQFEFILELEQSNQRIEKNGILIFEEAKKTKMNAEDAVKAGLKLFEQKIYGDSAVYFFVKLA